MLPKIKALLEGGQRLYPKNYTDQGRVLIQRRIWIGCQIKIRFKGTGYLYQYIASITTVHRPLKDDRGFKYSPSTFVKSHQPNPPSFSINPQKKDANVTYEIRIASGILAETIKEFKGCTIQSTIIDSTHSDSDEQVDAISDYDEQVDAISNSKEQVDAINDSEELIHTVSDT